VAVAKLAVVTVGAALTVIVSVLPSEGTPLESVAPTVKVCVVADPLTVPEMTPVDEVRASPVGGDPDETLQVIGAVPALEVSVCE
jgi:hypothetical protein